MIAQIKIVPTACFATKIDKSKITKEAPYCGAFLLQNIQYFCIVLYCFFIDITVYLQYEVTNENNHITNQNRYKLEEKYHRPAD